MLTATIWSKATSDAKGLVEFANLDLRKDYTVKEVVAPMYHEMDDTVYTVKGAELAGTWSSSQLYV